MYKRWSIVTLTFLFPLFLWSQTENLLEQGLSKTIEIKYASNQSSNPNNQILSLVAKAKGTSVNGMVLSYNVKEHQKIIKTGNNLQLQLAVGNFVFPDQVDYQKFDINKYLSPTQISYTYVFADENDNVLETKTITNEKFKNGDFLVKKNIPNTYNTSTFKLYLSEVKFGFTADNVTELNDFMAKVDAYYNADARLNLMEQELDLIRYDSIEMLELYKQQTLDNSKIFDQIRSEKFPSNLRLDANDPIQFKSHAGRVEVRNGEIKKELDKALNNMEVTYCLKGKDWVKWGDETKAILFFNKSKAVKQNYAPPHYELALIDYNHKNYSRAVDTCAKIISTMKPDTDVRYNTVKLVESVITEYLIEINNLIDQGNFKAALEKLTICENYSKTIDGVKYFQEYDEIHGKLFNAYYNQLADESQQLISHKKLVAAHKNIDSLASFRNLHSTYISTPEKENLLLNNLYTAWINYAKEQMGNEKPDSAVYALTQAKIICQKYEAVPCTNELESLFNNARQQQYVQMITQAENCLNDQLADTAIYLLEQAAILRVQYNFNKDVRFDGVWTRAWQMHYKQLIEIGDKAYHENQSREALAFYNEAKNIESKEKVSIDTTLNSKISNAAISFTLLLCIQGESLVEALLLDEARQKLHDAEQIAQQYGIQNNTEVTTALESLRSKLATGACDKAQYKYNIQIIAAEKFVEQREFIYASQALKNASEISKLNSDCIFSDASIKLISDNIRTMLHYQKQMMIITNSLEEQNYKAVIDDYTILTQYYNDSVENNFGIAHADLFPYILNHTDKEFINFSVGYYTQNGDFDKALELLNKLFELDFAASWCKENQTELGKQLAVSDREAIPDTNPKIKVVDYTLNNKWFKYLKKAYLAECKLK